MTFCTETTSDAGYVCRPRWTAIQFLLPVAGAIFNQSNFEDAGVVVTLVATAESDGGGTPPPTILGTTTLTKAGPIMWTGTASLMMGTGVRTIQALASFDAGDWSYSLDASVSVNVDTIAPVLTAIALDRPDAGDPDPGQPTAWKKDEKALVKVTCDDLAVAVGASNFMLPWGGPVAATSNARCACMAGCQCFEVDLAGTTINGIRDSVSLMVGPVRDAAGNLSNATSASVNVSRFKWERSLGSETNSHTLAASVSSNGLFVGGTSGSTPLLALKQDGTVQWSMSPAGLITAGPTLGTTNAWIGYRSGANIGLQPIALAGGVAGLTECTASNSRRFFGDLALAHLENPSVPDGEGAIGVREGSSSGGEFRAADGTCNSQSLSTTLSTFSGAARVVVSERPDAGIDVYAAGSGGTLWKANLMTPSWSSQGSAIFSVAPAMALFLGDGANFVGGGGVANGGVFSTSTANALTATTNFVSYAPAGAAQAGPASVGVDFVIYGDTSGNLVKVDYSNGAFDGGVSVSLTSASTQDVSPVLGAGSLVYVVSKEGKIFVRNTNALATPLWSTTFATSVDALGQPALDVLRDAAGTKQCRGLGVLYVPSSLNGVAKVTALLVDSEGLAPNAPWPKYQRDNANTGNASRSLAPWTCQ